MNLFSIWFCFFFLTDSQYWTFFECNSKNCFFFQRDWKNRTFLFLEYESKNRTHFCLNTTQWIEPSLTWLEELNFFRAWVKELDFWVFLKKKTQRIELSPKIRYKELNFFFFSIWLKDFFQYDSKNWTLLYNMTQRLGFFHPKKKLKEFDFLWLTDLNLLFKIFFQKMTRRIDPFFFTMTLKMEFFFWSTNTNHRAVFFQYESQNWFFFEHDFFQNWIIFFWIRLEELKFSNTTQRIQLFFFRYDSKNWTFLVL